MKKYIVLVFAVFLFSCESLFMKPQPENTPKSIFDQVWTFVNEKYAFFEYKNVDWKQIYNKYQTRISDNMSEEELFQVCYDMLYELKDEHTNLISKFNISRNPEVFLDYPENYSGDLLNRNYFKGRTQIVSPFSYFDFGDVAYFRYDSFIDSISDEALDYILERAKTKKGLILDVRNNGGGAVINIDKLASRFISDTTLLGTEFHKNGPGKNDFVEEKSEIYPAKDVEMFLDKPLVILTNRGCYSATNIFAAFMKGLKNVTLVGGKTGGGGGLPTATELSNGWILRVSGSITLDRNGFNIENGVEPDIKIDMSKADMDKGKDTVLEEGLRVIRQN